MKKILSILISVMMVLSLTACSKSNTNSVSLDDLKEAMVSADTSLPDMSEADSNSDDAENLFSYLSDLDYSKVNQFFMEYASAGTAEEIAVIEAKNTNDVNEAEKSLESHVQDRIKLYENYEPEEVERAQKALIFTKDNFAVLIISDEQNKVKDAFNNFINK